MKRTIAFLILCMIFVPFAVLAEGETEDALSTNTVLCDQKRSLTACEVSWLGYGNGGYYINSYDINNGILSKEKLAMVDPDSVDQGRIMLLPHKDTGFRYVVHVVHYMTSTSPCVKLWGIKKNGDLQLIPVAESVHLQPTEKNIESVPVLCGETIVFTDDNDTCQSSTLDGRQVKKISDYPRENTNSKGDALAIIVEIEDKKRTNIVKICNGVEDREILRTGLDEEYQFLSAWGWWDDNRLVMLLERKLSTPHIYDVLVFNNDTKELHYLYNEKGERINVVTQDGIFQYLFFSPDGDKLIYIEFLGYFVYWHNIVMLSLDTGESEVLCSSEDTGTILALPFSVVWNCDY